MSPFLISTSQCISDVDVNSTSLPSCHRHANNASIPDDIMSSLALNELGPAMIFIPTFTALLFVFYVLFFWPKYKRINAEKKASFEQSVYVGSTEI